jgi:hypothetical protein
MELKSRLDLYRSKLVRGLKRGKNPRTSAAIIKGLLSDFDEIFHMEILNDRVDIHPLIENHCHPWPGCPLCNAAMETKIGKFGGFWGCSKYPDCQGVRGKNKEVSVNDALKFFLAKKEFEVSQREKEEENSRWNNIEL